MSDKGQGIEVRIYGATLTVQGKSQRLTNFCHPIRNQV